MIQSYLKENWSDLPWTSWYSFNDIMENRSLLSSSPGMCRIKAVGLNHLMYIGQTGRNLRERLTDLIRNTLKDQMPFNDPHTAAPSLWAWRDAEGWDFEISVATVNLLKENREGLECNLLCKYRLERGESTLCNHGRFHPDYVKSKARKSGFRGGILADSSPRNTAWGESKPPLHFQGTPTSLYFMGLKWADVYDWNQLSNVPQKEGVYRIFGLDTNTLLYIGQSKKLKNRFKSHSKKDWGQEARFTYSILENVKEFQLKEIENDLIGGYYSINKNVPEFQFKNLKESK